MKVFMMMNSDVMSGRWQPLQLPLPQDGANDGNLAHAGAAIGTLCVAQLVAKHIDVFVRQSVPGRYMKEEEKKQLDPPMTS